MEQLQDTVDRTITLKHIISITLGHSKLGGYIDWTVMDTVDWTVTLGHSRVTLEDSNFKTL